MMEVKDNFGFLKEHDAALYEKIKKAEAKVKTDPHGAATELRQPFEEFIRIIERKNGLDTGEKRDLFDSINAIIEMDKLFDKKVSYVTVFGERENAGRLHFIRMLLNSSVHAEEKANRKWPRVNEVTAMTAMRVLHTLTRNVFVGSDAEMTFSTYFCPLGEYYIYDTYVPCDAAISQCLREYRGVKYDSTRSEIISYAVIREYDAEEGGNQIFRLRNEKCFNTASKYSIESVPRGMVDTSAIKTIGRVRSYYTCYSFRQEPHAFTNARLKEMSFEEKTECCRIIAHCLNQLHQSDVPIYHRLLNSGSIYLCRIGGRWIPFVTKFDCAKIDTGNTEETVIDFWKKTKEQQEHIVEIYQPPECRDGRNPDEIDWAKVDIYSLGMLFANIYTEKLGSEVLHPNRLRGRGCSEEMIALIEDMAADEPARRPSIREVVERM